MSSPGAFAVVARRDVGAGLRLLLVRDLGLAGVVDAVQPREDAGAVASGVGGHLAGDGVQILGHLRDGLDEMAVAVYDGSAPLWVAHGSISPPGIRACDTMTGRVACQLAGRISTWMDRMGMMGAG